MGHKLIQLAVSRALRRLPFIRANEPPFDTDGDVCLMAEPSPYHEKFWLVAPVRERPYQNSLNNLRNGRVQLFFEYRRDQTWRDFRDQTWRDFLRMEIPNAKEATLARVVLWAQEKYALNQIVQAE